MSLNWNLQRGGGFKPKNPLLGEYGYFLEPETHKELKRVTHVRCL